MKKIKLLAIGNEIIEGDIANSHAQYLSQRLRAAGFDVVGHEAVKDNETDILDAFEYGFKKADVIITTGGLGPTPDDLSKEVAAQYFGMELVEHPQSLALIKGFFEKFHRPMGISNLKQAFFPADALILENPKGTAPGAVFEKEDKTIILLPGPTNEMRFMFSDKVLPYLQQFQNEAVAFKMLRLCGIGESQLIETMTDLMGDHDGVRVAPYANDNEVHLRITASAPTKESVDQRISAVASHIRERVGQYIYAENGNTLEMAVAEILLAKKLTIALAESCTGGLIASKLINFPGISSIFLEGIVCYSNESKIARLGVSPDTLRLFGAVSSETAEAMAQGVAKTSGALVGLSVTGIAGPSGGSEEKPVGLVYLGFYFNGKARSLELHLAGDRYQVRSRATQLALNWLYRILTA